MKTAGRISIFWHYATCYAGIVLFSCALIGLLLTNTSIITLNSVSNREQQHKLTLAADYLDSQNILMMRMAYKIQIAPEYRSSALRVSAYKSRLMLNNFSNYSNYVPIASTYFMVYRDLELIYKPSSTGRARYFLPGELGISDYTAYINKILAVKKLTIFSSQENPNLLLYAVPIHMGDSQKSEPDSILCFVVMKDNLFQQLTSVVGAFEGELAVYFDNMLILGENSAPENAAELITSESIQKSFSLTLNYTENGMRLVLNSVANISGILTVIIVVLLILSLLIAYRNYTPIRKLVIKYKAMSSVKPERDNELSAISKILDTALLNAKDSAQELSLYVKDLNRQRELLKRHFFRLLLSGAQVDIDEGVEQELGISNPEAKYLIAAVYGLGESKKDRFIRLVEDMSDDILRFYAHKLNKPAILALLIIMKDQGAAEKPIELIHAIADEAGCKISVSSGGILGSLEEVYPSLRETIIKHEADVETNHACERGSGRQASEIVDCINKNATDYNITIAQIAEKFGLTERQISHIVRNEVFMSYKEYITSIRISNACRLLKETEIPISKISENVGFLCVSYFIRIFKDSTGKTPANYRREERERSADAPALYPLTDVCAAPHT